MPRRSVGGRGGASGWSGKRRGARRRRDPPSAVSPHDLRNLLTAIDGHAQLARAAVGDDHPAREDIEEVLAATSRAHQLTEAWLAGPSPRRRRSCPRRWTSWCAGSCRCSPPSPDRHPDRAPPRGARPGAHQPPAPGARAAQPVPQRPRRDGRRRRHHDRRRPPGRMGRWRSRWRTPARASTPPVVDRLFDPTREPPGRVGGHGLGLLTSRALLEEAGGALEVESRPGPGPRCGRSLPRA